MDASSMFKKKLSQSWRPEVALFSFYSAVVVLKKNRHRVGGTKLQCFPFTQRSNAFKKTFTELEARSCPVFLWLYAVVISKKSKDRENKIAFTSSGFPGGHFGKTTAAASPGANDSALEATSNHRGWNGFSCMLSSQQSTHVPTLLLHSMSSTKKKSLK